VGHPSGRKGEVGVWDEARDTPAFRMEETQSRVMGASPLLLDVVASVFPSHPQPGFGGTGGAGVEGWRGRERKGKAPRS
jgi:hypothetical protein